ncbi:hypothetical protein TNCV_3032821 [Trichonephila clavipes]|nr:hypothetical protein TNCV_3032821 [Trichonephila clavipes]
MLEKVIENWTSRLDYIRASRGSPMPEIILKIKDVRRGPISRIGLKMIMKCEDTSDLGVLPGRRRKPVGTETFDEVAAAVVERASCGRGSRVV